MRSYKMRVYRDFKCIECEEVTERYIDNMETQIDCPVCKGTAYKMLSAPRSWLDGTDPTLPGAYDKWARTREQNARIKGKRSYAGE